MPSTLAELRRASPSTPKCPSLDSHLHRLKKSNRQECTGILPSQRPLEFNRIQGTSLLQYPSVLQSRQFSGQTNTSSPQPGASQNATWKTWKRTKCQQCSGRRALHRVETDCRPAKGQSNVSKIEQGYRQFLRTIDDRVSDKKAPLDGDMGNRTKVNGAIVERGS